MKDINLLQELPRFIDSACIPIFVVDVHQNVCQWNHAIEELSSYNIEEINDLGISSIFIAKDRHRVTKIITESIQERTTKNIDVSFRNKNGSVINLILSSSTRRNADGHIIGVIVVGQDVTELRKSQLELVHASKLPSLSEMTESLAHELNQPLNVISLTASNVLRKISDNEDSEYLVLKLEKIKIQAFRAGEIVHRMRMFGLHSISIKEPIENYQSISSESKATKIRG